MKKKSCAFALLVVMMLSLGAVAEETQPLVNLFLFETNVRDALSEISMQTGVNIIPDSTVSGFGYGGPTGCAFGTGSAHDSHRRRIRL